MRRSRIKVVANVPKRRKTDNVEPTAGDANANENEEKVDETPEQSVQVNDQSKNESETIETPENESITNDPEIKLEQRRFRVKAAAKIPVRRKINTPSINVPETKSSEDNAVPETVKTPAPFLSPTYEASTSQFPLSPLVNTNYPRPSPSSSPHKPLNRSSRLFRSAPRIGFRRNSTSASESEDETRRSTCSNISHVSKLGHDTTSVASGGGTGGGSVVGNAPTILSVATITNPLTLSSSDNSNRLTLNQKKKVRRSEFARKIAEAKRDFHHKFGNKIPDRQKLTMMDLIFYNPTNNPMPLREVRKSDETSSVASIHDDDIADIVATAEEEAADEPEEEAMPVPQVKIGENGEIILDEQSLVIETSDMKKINKAAGLNAPVINYDELETGYGVYKRARRTKDWSDAETKQFYRVLQMFGTDFSLMLSYFKNRTRRDLKLKFKKEEKINRQLIDKVLLNPRTFDVNDLEKLLEEDEKVEKKKMEEKNKIKELKKNDVEKRKKEKRGKAISFFARQVYSDKSPIISTKDDSVPVEPSPSEAAVETEVEGQKSKNVLKKRIKMKIDSENEDNDDIENLNLLTQQQFENMFKNPTKSGRMIKSRLPSLTNVYETKKHVNDMVMEIAHEEEPEVEAASDVLQLQIISTSNAISKVVATRLRSSDGIIDENMTADDLYNALGDDLGITIDESLSQQPSNEPENPSKENEIVDSVCVEENENNLDCNIEYLEEVLSTPSSETVINKETSETQNEGIPIDVNDEQFPLLQSFLGNSDSITLDVAVANNENVLS